jgi:uncharacterized membrane protein
VSWVFDEEVLAVLTALTIIVAVLAGFQAFYSGRVVEPFSELGLLDSSGKIGKYPKEVSAGSPLLLNVYVGNHEGRAVYYRVLVKAGDKSSFINASTPLPAEPLIDIRTILSHNSSRIIPVNVVLNKPAVNVRLVFEMWIYDESSGVFKYHGRWNQLWINVTKPSTQASLQQIKTLTPEFESRIAEAYLAIRRVENAGGDSSEMVNLLNSAIEYAYSNDLGKAETLINNVLTIEPEAAKAGVEASRNRLYLTVSSLAAFSSICLAIYLYLRSNIWLLWAKAHRKWRIVWCKSVEGKTWSTPKSINELTVKDLVEGLNPLAHNARIAAKKLYGMVKSGTVKIIDPNPPKTFRSFLLSRYNLGFTTALLILVVGIICIYSTEPLQQTSFKDGFQIFSAFPTAVRFMRYVLGSIIVLFLPGYSLVEALYPDRRSLKPLERLALSIGLSLALTPLIGLILNYTPWGIRLNPTTTAITTLTTTLLTISAYRKYIILKLEASSTSKKTSKTISRYDLSCGVRF